MAGLMNLARESSATTGAGTLTLAGAVNGCISFATAAAAAGIASGDTITYGIEDGGSSEVGRGVWTSPSTLTRTTILASTSGGSAINCSGTQEVFCVAAAEDVSKRLIEKKTLSGVSTVAFSTIPQSFDHLRVVIVGRSSAGSSPAVNVNAIFNSDSGANYDNNQYQKTSTGAALNNATAGLSALIAALIPWSGATASYNGHGILDIFNYTDTNLFKVGRSRQATMGATSVGASWVVQDGGILWRNTAAITRIDLTLSAGNGVAGSAAWLYGIR